MTIRAGAAGSLLGRLLLLGLLFIGLGVIHTLAHADAHEGLTTSGHTHTRTSPGATITTASDADTTPVATAADPDSLPDADCWASVPAGSWLIPPAQSVAENATTASPALPANGPPGRNAHTSLHALGVLRI
ncbi:hypothetical protein EJ357_41365 [Streptomyces cyaneochromogenes]|uniref:Uncharacterized protein n=1 Tax=Streptomyces cyaneochromogenes TaxID=2496836 RepID=A0A3S9MIU7_9ACTN|nr:hypothetical protein [Streptomyces cyaneochromogenes]AZQ39092.1 hypothetical protein EJ357_41365 [Streptomyces cyaneochromogenes]